MYCKTEPQPAFSEKPAFKVPSSWTLPIPDVQQELHLSEKENIFLSINKSDQS